MDGPGGSEKDAREDQALAAKAEGAETFQPTTDPIGILDQLYGYRLPQMSEEEAADRHFIRACLRLARKAGRKEGRREAERRREKESNFDRMVRGRRPR